MPDSSEANLTKLLEQAANHITVETPPVAVITATWRRRTQRHRYIAGALVAAAVIGTVAVTTISIRGGDRQAASTQAQSTPADAVLPDSSETGNPTEPETAVAMLAETGGMTVVAQYLLNGGCGLTVPSTSIEESSDRITLTTTVEPRPEQVCVASLTLAQTSVPIQLNSPLAGRSVWQNGRQFVPLDAGILAVPDYLPPGMQVLTQEGNSTTTGETATTDMWTIVYADASDPARRFSISTSITPRDAVPVEWTPSGEPATIGGHVVQWYSIKSNGGIQQSAARWTTGEIEYTLVATADTDATWQQEITHVLEQVRTPN